MLGTYLSRRDLRKNEVSKAIDGERIDDDVSSMELVNMAKKGETAKVEVVHIEEKC